MTHKYAAKFYPTKLRQNDLSVRKGTLCSTFAGARDVEGMGRGGLARDRVQVLHHRLQVPHLKVELLCALGTLEKRFDYK